MTTSKFDLSEIKALLARSQELIERVENPGVDFLQPQRVFLSCSFLVDPMFSLRLEDLNHDYPDKPFLMRDNFLEATVIHGHSFTQVCAAPHFCHIGTFRPGPEYTPSFRKQFNGKWGYKNGRS